MKGLAVRSEDEREILMRQPRAGKLPTLIAVLCVLWISTAYASDPACPSIAIEADASVRRHWPGLAESLRASFGERRDIDSCARVELAMKEGSIAVEVILPDGRSAARSVSRAEDVMSTLEALLLVPTAPASGTSTSDVSEPRQPRAAARELMVLSEASRPGTTANASGLEHRATAFFEPAPSHLRIELSVISGARIGDNRTGVGVGVLSFLDVNGWLIGFQGRADRYQTLQGNAPEPALELGLLGGRRFRFQTLSLDLVAGPAIVPQGNATFAVKSVTTGEVRTGSTSSTAPRLIVGARLNFRPRSVLRTFVGFDAEVGPGRLGDVQSPLQPSRLPTWTVGLTFGGTVGTL